MKLATPRGRRKRWVLGVKRVGLGLLGAGMVSAAILLPGFLTVTKPLGQGILAVEAWIPERTLAESVNIFDSGRYRYLVVVGGPMGDIGEPNDHPESFAELAATRLEELGFDDKKLVKISVPPEVLGDRTLATALAVKRWLGAQKNPVCCVDVFTEGVHSRKSWIIFRYALGGNYRVGIIAGVPASYSPHTWFFSTHGIYIVVRNLIGYLYSESWILYDNESSPDVVRATARS